MSHPTNTNSPTPVSAPTLAPTPTSTSTTTPASADKNLASDLDAERSPIVAARRRAVAGVVITLLGGALWGCNGTLVSYLLSHYHVQELWLVVVRELGASVLFLATALLTNRENLVGILRDKSSLAQLIITAFTCILFSNVCYIQAISWTNPATATVLQALNIVMVVVWVCLSTKRKPRPREVAGGLLALIGTFLLATGGDPSQLHLPVQGLVWGLGAALAAALLSILPIKLLNRWGSFVVNGWAMLISGVVLALIVKPWAHIPALDTLGWTLVTCSIIFGTFGSYALFLHGVKVVGAVKSSMLSTSEPLMAMVSSVLVLGTHFSATDLVGFVLIIIMVYLSA